ncbi:MAG TPA: thioredoxin domain-containing protein [Nitrospiraceae bacterium]|nr:thioredoxin domain-containing protein [Nitrospiraceae bacterium]
MKLPNGSFLILPIVLLLGACQAKGPGAASELQALQQQLAVQKELLEGIRSDIERIKKVIEEGRRHPFQLEGEPQPVSTDDDHIRGRADAKLTLIEFSDFQCPFCERFYRETLPLIDRDYIQTGKVRMVYRDFPLASVHENAQKAAEAAQCAGEQGKYWEMHDQIFANHTAMSVEDLKKHARGLGIAVDRFDRCLESGAYAEEVKKDMADGQALGVQGTPTFFVGPTGKDNTIQGIRIAGARPYAVFKQMFDRFLEAN